MTCEQHRTASRSLWYRCLIFSYQNVDVNRSQTESASRINLRSSRQEVMNVLRCLQPRFFYTKYSKRTTWYRRKRYFLQPVLSILYILRNSEILNCEIVMLVKSIVRLTMIPYRFFYRFRKYTTKLTKIFLKECYWWLI